MFRLFLCYIKKMTERYALALINVPSFLPKAVNMTEHYIIVE